MNPYIEAQNISFSYASGAPILRGVSLAIAKGERVAVTGPSGCGKSTLGFILAGHLRPQSGHVMINGEERTGRPSRDVFVVHQENDLFPWLKARDQIALAMKEKSHEKIDQLLHLMQLENQAEAYPHQLSGGMKKRLAIARALALQPKLIVLDESFASLDHPLRLRLFDELKTIGRQSQIALLMITHDPRDIELFEAREIRIS